ncbi:MAG: hypothetical protein RSH25_15065 [Bacteroides sp.]|uniref:hypothetical protein n=1 Tax=Bacteroides sp. TaxID=29523 RepID=UPI002FC59931
MTTYELLKIHENLIMTMQQQTVEISDVRYLDMYREYLRMVQEGHKKTYIIAFLSDEYNIGQRTVYRVIDKFSADVEI